MGSFKIIVVLLVLGMTTPGNAQFLKKLGDRAKDAAARTVERKVAQKTERQTEKTFDTVFNNKGGLFNSKKTEKLESYTFSHQYIMEVISEKDTTDITYYLTNIDEYLGSSFSKGKNEKFITVMDLPNSAVHTFMDMGGRKTTSSFRIDLEDVSDTETDNDQFSIASTGQSKKIIGYECEEFQVTGPQLSGTVWVTQEANISFQKAFASMMGKKIKGQKGGIDPAWTSRVDGLALEMEMIDYSQKNPKPVKMVCTDLSENNFSINTLDYEKSF